MKGTEFGVLNESFIGKEVHNVFLDDEAIGEIHLNALIAGHFGVPVAFVSGDTKACEEAQQLLGDELETFAVKTGIDKFAARCLHPAVTRKGIREGVARALGNLDALAPLKLDGPARFGIEWNSTTIATTCSFIPTVEKTSARITEFTSDDPTHALKVMFVELVLALEIARSSRVYA
jgi:D-amino peptidase